MLGACIRQGCLSIRARRHADSEGMPAWRTDSLIVQLHHAVVEKLQQLDLRTPSSEAA